MKTEGLLRSKQKAANGSTYLSIYLQLKVWPVYATISLIAPHQGVQGVQTLFHYLLSINKQETV